MSDPSRLAFDQSETFVSPYLMRPLRTYEQAVADIAAVKQRAGVVQPFISLVTSQDMPNIKSILAA